VIRRPLAIAIPWGLVLVAAACATPPSRFYQLSAASQPSPSSTSAAPTSTLAISVGPVAIPAAIDRPQVVLTVGPNQVRLDEFNRWAGPVQNEIARVVVENLVTMLGTPHVTLFPQSLGAGADYRAAIEVQRFDSALGTAATLDAVWTVSRSKDGRARTGRTTVREPVQDTSYDALLAAHSRATARLSRDIADAVQALE